MKRVVITGMGVISPVGNDVDSMWESLMAGKHGIAPITRFDITEFKTKLAAEVKDFDPLQYMEKNEVRRSDLYCQYAYAAACQAMYDSKLEGKVEPERFGVYLGSGIGGIDSLTREHEKLLSAGPRKVSPYFIPMMISNIAAGNIAIRYGAKGPCMAVVTACATGSTAIGESVRAIRHGYADAMITGGAEAAINPLGMAGFINMMALSTAEDPDAASLPFDSRRAGFVMGEGAGVMVLEEYEHAVSRGAVIYGEIVGYGSTCDAYHMTSPDPEGASSSRAIADALREADYQVNEAVYVNAHGTGTALNDTSETEAIKRGFSNQTGAVAVSSTKSMTGHMLGAAGAVEAIICAKTLMTGMVPPTIGLLEQDPKCDLDYVPLKARKDDPSLALSVSLGFGGHNTCLALRKINQEESLQ